MLSQKMHAIVDKRICPDAIIAGVKSTVCFVIKGLKLSRKGSDLIL